MEKKSNSLVNQVIKNLKNSNEYLIIDILDRGYESTLYQAGEYKNKVCVRTVVLKAINLKFWKDNKRQKYLISEISNLKELSSNENVMKFYDYFEIYFDENTYLGFIV